MESSDWPNSNYIFVCLSPCSCAGGRVSLADQSLRQETEAKELLYCGKGQRSWLFLRQADTVAVLKSTVKLDNKLSVRSLVSGLISPTDTNLLREKNTVS